MVSAPDSTLDVPPAVENDISDIRVDSVGDFTFPERNKFDSGFGITSKTVDTSNTPPTVGVDALVITEV